MLQQPALPQNPASPRRELPKSDIPPSTESNNSSVAHQRLNQLNQHLANKLSVDGSEHDGQHLEPKQPEEDIKRETPEERKEVNFTAQLLEDDPSSQKHSSHAISRSEKQAPSRKNSVIHGSLLSENSSAVKDHFDHSKNFAYTTKISALSQIKPRKNQELDESLAQLAMTLKSRGTLPGAERQDSLAYSNASMSNIFITPIKMLKEDDHTERDENEKVQSQGKPPGNDVEQLNMMTQQQKSVMIREQEGKEQDRSQLTDMKETQSQIKQTSFPQEISTKSLSNPSKFHRRPVKSSVFSLERSDNLKLKEAEIRRKELQRELQLINSQISTIKQSSPKPHHNLIERINISDDINAKAKAVELVHRLNHEKKERQKALETRHLTQFDKELFSSIEQIKRIREERQMKQKQRKRVEVIERMKQQELRKNETKRQQKANLRFLKDVIWGGELSPGKSRQEIAEKPSPHQEPEKNLEEEDHEKVYQFKSLPNRRISEEGKTPELSNKKSRLKKLRNIENAQGRSVVEEYNALLFKK